MQVPEYVIDASSIIYGWDNYPIAQFPGLWEWLATQIAEQYLIIASVAFDEVADNSPECAVWLNGAGIFKIIPQNAILQDARRMMRLLGIMNDDFHPKGVGENDLIIIASAKSCGRPLISDESRQKVPDLPKKRKIPAVCTMPEVTVQCINFLEYIKKSGMVFR